MFKFYVTFFYASNDASCASAFAVASCVANKLRQMTQLSIIFLFSYTSGTYQITPTNPRTETQMQTYSRYLFKKSHDMFKYVDKNMKKVNLKKTN